MSVILKFLWVSPAYAPVISPAEAATRNPRVICEQSSDVSPETLKIYAECKAKEVGVDWVLLERTIDCESKWNYDKVGDNGTSFGIAQIHLPAHLTVTKEQALNPYFSLDWMVQKFVEGKKDLWTCARQLTRTNEYR